MNIRQFELMQEVYDTAKQMVYEQMDQMELDCQYMRNKIIYLKNLIAAYEKEEKER